MAKMSELNVDISQLPQDVRDKLAELDLELSEGRKEMGLAFVYIRWELVAAVMSSRQPQPSTPSYT